MMKNESIIIEAKKILLSSQDVNGNYPGITKSPQNIEKKFQTTFYASLILNALSVVRDPELENTKEKLSHFLLTQKSDNWTFNWWVRESSESKKKAYPDDLDDTVCALLAIQKYDEAQITGKVLSSLTRMLITVEQKEGGPYGTWLVSDDKKDIDIAVNANIAHLLSENGVVLPGLNSYLLQKILSQEFVSKYYVSKYAVIYFLSRNESLENKSKIILQKFLGGLLKERNNLGILDLIFITLSLIHLGANQKIIIEQFNKVTDQIQKKGFVWDPFVVEEIRNGKKYRSSNLSLLAALFLECDTRISNMSGAKNKTRYKFAKKQKKLLLSIQSDIKNVEKEVKKRFLMRLVKTLRDDKNNQHNTVSLMPFIFCEMLGKKINDELLTDLSKVGIYGWLSYTIFDDFLDEEGDPANLPVANIAHRLLLYSLENVGKNNNFYKLGLEVLLKMDEANAWEVTNARIKIKNKKLILKKSQIPDYKNFTKLYKRSLGHSLPALGVLFAMGYNSNSPEVKKIFSFFKNFIIAKQLNDDAHDWEDDLQRGHLSPVVSEVLGNYMKKNHTYKIDMEFDSLLESLQEQFWYEDINKICKLIFRFSKNAREDIESMKFLKDTSFFLEMIQSNEIAAKKALLERKKTIEFLEEFEQ